ncbi:ATP-dependent DNA helicase [Tessaracoccus caeni]|uniref:ATP-dependent DNA helicase n=1 Tax=Tessaracoccus caeni TaxID=3031239 RepID=UPI0023DC27EA|nr:ATP-dependent DNA helicase [Tessaracoccus caeni]MDF1488464.1 ATP-dependent DNA helicase [Tessaracoccus caeni]
MTARITTHDELCDALGIPFSAEQLAAITSPLEPSVIIAGAGSGKTTVMAARVVWLVGTGQAEPEDILGLTFTRKAAAELEQRVTAALERAGVLSGDDGEGVPVVQTYDSFAARVVSEFGLRIGIDMDPAMITGAARFRLASKVVAQAPGPLESLSRLRPATLARRALDFDAELQSHLVSAEELRAFTQRSRSRFEAAPLYRGAMMKDVRDAVTALDERLELLGLVELYQEAKRRRGVVEFADQLRRAVELVRRVPQVCEELRARHPVLLLDEYQDTSAAQAQLLHRIFGAAPGHPVTAVGDPHQAIYGWRGAAAGNIVEFPRLFRKADGSEASGYTLSVNRRSGQRILDVGNELAAGSADHPSVSLVAPQGTPAGQVWATQFDTENDEFAWITERILAEHERRPWQDMAVLVRRNAMLGPLFEKLRDADVPVEIVGLGGLLGLPEIAPVVATLRAINDVLANPDVAALLTGPRWALGLADLHALGQRARELAARDERQTQGELDDELSRVVRESDPGEAISLLDAVADPGDAPLTPEGRRRIGRFGEEMAELRRHAGEPVTDVVGRVISMLGLETELLALGEEPTQLARFVAEAAAYVDVDGDGSLGGFLAYLEAEEEQGDGLQQALPSETDSVKLMTVHRAKGLEWPAVFLPGLSDTVFPGTNRSGMWPTRAELVPAPLRGDSEAIPQLGEYSKKGMEGYRALLKDEHLVAEDRLAYVAATRAKQLLVGTRHTWAATRIQPLGASRYFDAIRSAAEERGRYDDRTTPGLDENPTLAAPVRAAWPVVLNDDEVAARREGARFVEQAARLVGRSKAAQEAWVWGSGVASADEARLVAEWDEARRHLEELAASAARRHVVLPEGLSATALMQLREDEQAFAANLVRRMPRPPSRAIRVGTKFHDWVQRRFELPAALDELVPMPGAHPPQLDRLIAAFEGGLFAHRAPLEVEVPFVMNWKGQILRGRIDAVYLGDDEDHDYLVVDWKTSSTPADELQLAIYRQAWAEAMGVPPERVAAGFYYVLSDRLEIAEAPPELIDAALPLSEGDR